MGKFIFYELNEVPKRLFNFYGHAFPQSSFGKLLRTGAKFETVCEDIGHLSPWITWPTLHRGVTNQKHEISNLGQNLTETNREYPPIWSLLQRNGVDVGVFGSLQSYDKNNINSSYKFFVPDTFADTEQSFPENLSAFQKLNLRMTRINGRNVSRTIPIKEACNFLIKAPSLGLSPVTAVNVAAQIVQEIYDNKKVVRRRTSQAQIAFDLFYHALRKQMPRVSFFFTNHVASSMHRYWPTIFPEDYDDGQFSKDWLTNWQKEIPHALNVTDHHLTRLIDFVDQNRGFTLVVASSMGQAAVKKAKTIKNQALITNIRKLMDKINIPKEAWLPHLAMAPRVVVTVKSDRYYSRLAELGDYKVNGEPIECIALGNGDFALHLEVTDIDTLSIEGPHGETVEGVEMGVELVDLQDAAGSNAYHVPEGILITYSQPNNNKVGHKDNPWELIQSTSVAPSLLHNLGITPPSYMMGDRLLFA